MNGEIRSRLREAEVRKVTDYIRDMCCLLAGDKEAKRERLPNDENRIRNILLEEYMNQGTGMNDYRFSPEMNTNYNGNGRYKGRTDMHIVFKSDFEKREASFIVECKRLDGGKTLNRKYVEEGIGRFVAENPKYSSYYGISMMLGFVVKPIDICGNARKIEGIQNKKDDLAMHGIWEHKDRTKKTERFECTYRNRQEPVRLQHLFADFSKII